MTAHRFGEIDYVIREPRLALLGKINLFAPEPQQRRWCATVALYSTALAWGGHYLRTLMLDDFSSREAADQGAVHAWETCLVEREYEIAADDPAALETRASIADDVTAIMWDPGDTTVKIQFTSETSRWRFLEFLRAVATKGEFNGDGDRAGGGRA